MHETATLASTIRYSDKAGSVSWEGRHVADVKRFGSFLRDVVRPRIVDGESSFEPDVLGLATTGMATEFVARLLTAVPEPEGWEVGEALAECVLQADSGREVYWPWNTVRDRRTPRASLPGADLVGFCRGTDGILLLFGEVKTSSDVKTPPNVMNGGSGMAWQLAENANRLDVQLALLKWLHARCQSEPSSGLYKEAVGRYLCSQGKELLLIGVLIRDTVPSELDLESRGRALSKKLRTPTCVYLMAWYLPVPVAEWPKLLQEEAP